MRLSSLFLLIMLPLTLCLESIPINLGTTLVAVKFDKGVVVAADTRTSTYTYVSHRYAQKIVPINDHVVLCRSGSSAATQWLAESLREVVDECYRKWDEQLSVCQVAHWLRHEILDTSLDGASLLVAGYDMNNNLSRVFTVSQSGALLESPGQYSAAGSGSSFVTGYLDQEIDVDEELTEQRAMELCTNSVKLAIDRDGSSGGLIRLCVITKEGRREISIYPDGYKKKGDEKASVGLLGFAPRGPEAFRGI